MVELFIFILTAYGATNIMIYGSIFSGFRKIMGVNREKEHFIGKLFGCFMCLSFWWGVILSYVLYSPTMESEMTQNLLLFDFVIDGEYLALFFDACLASGSVWLVHTIQERIEV
jgi:hypothetical protein